MATVIQENLEHKARVEHDFARPALDRALEAWLQAPNAEKPELLLNGQLLSWGESWLLSHPEEVSANQKNFILRSLAAQSRKGAVEREMFQKRQIRRESKYLWLIMGCATFALIPQIIEFQKDVKRELKRELQEHVMDGQPPSSMRAVLRAIVRKARTGGSGSDLAKNQPRRDADDDLAAPQEPDDLESAGNSPADVFAANASGPQNLKRRVDLAELSQSLVHQGETRRALLVALEFLHTPHTDAKTADYRRQVVTTNSSVYAANASRAPILATSESFATGSAPYFCNDANRLIAADIAEGLHVWDRPKDGTSLPTRTGAAPLQTLAALDPACNRMVVLSPDHDAELVVLANRRSIAKLTGHANAIVAANFSSNGQRLVTVARDSTAKLWDAPTGRRIADIQSDDAIILGANLNPDGTRLVTWSGDSFVRLWDVNTRRTIATLRGHAGSVTNAVFSPTGTHVATTSNDGAVRIWNGATGSIISTLRSDGVSLDAMRFSPDGSRIATLNEDINVEIWDVRSGQHLANLKEKGRESRAFTFSPDGELLTTIDWNGNTALWRATGGEKIAELSMPGEPLLATTFSPDGQTVSAITAAGVLLHWPLLTSRTAVMDHATKVAGTCLTREERTNLQLRPDLPRWCPETEPVDHNP